MAGISSAEMTVTDYALVCSRSPINRVVMIAIIDGDDSCDSWC